MIDRGIGAGDRRRSDPRGLLSRAYFLERPCAIQVRTCGMGLPLHAPSREALARTDGYLERASPDYAREHLWPAMLRRLNRISPGYDS